MQKVRMFATKITVMWISFIYSALSLADIPGVEENADGVGAGDGIYAFSSGWIKTFVAFSVPTILGFIFMWMVWELWGKINEQRGAKEPQWNGVIAFGGASGVYFIIATFISAAVLGIYD